VNHEHRVLIEETAECASKKVLKDTLTALGIDASEPFQVQKDMAALRELRVLLEDPEIQKDLMHLRKWRVNMETVQSRGLTKAVGLLILGALVAIGYGIKMQFFGG